MKLQRFEDARPLVEVLLDRDVDSPDFLELVRQSGLGRPADPGL